MTPHVHNSISSNESRPFFALAKVARRRNIWSNNTWRIAVCASRLVLSLHPLVTHDDGSSAQVTPHFSLPTMTESHCPTAQQTKHLYPSPQGALQLVDSSRSKDWLPDMIFAAKALAAGAQFVPLPCVRAAFDTVVTFLETVNVCSQKSSLLLGGSFVPLQKIKKNREDLRDLCASTLEIIIIVQEETKAHGEIATARFTGLIENFVL